MRTISQYPFTSIERSECTFTKEEAYSKHRKGQQEMQMVESEIPGSKGCRE